MTKYLLLKQDNKSKKSIELNEFEIVDICMCLKGYECDKNAYVPERAKVIFDKLVRFVNEND